MVASAFAADPPKAEEALVTISQANVCYKAKIERGGLFFLGEVITRISPEVPCHGTAIVLSVWSMKKNDGNNCTYHIGKDIGENAKYNRHFPVTARCPTDQK